MSFCFSDTYLITRDRTFSDKKPQKFGQNIAKSQIESRINRGNWNKICIFQEKIHKFNKLVIDII